NPRLAYPGATPVIGTIIPSSGNTPGSIVITVPRSLVDAQLSSAVLSSVTASTLTQDAPGDSDPTGNIGPYFNVVDVAPPYDVALNASGGPTTTATTSTSTSTTSTSTTSTSTTST